MAISASFWSKREISRWALGLAVPRAPSETSVALLRITRVAGRWTWTCGQAWVGAGREEESGRAGRARLEQAISRLLEREGIEEADLTVAGVDAEAGFDSDLSLWLASETGATTAHDFRSLAASPADSLRRQAHADSLLFGAPDRASLVVELGGEISGVLTPPLGSTQWRAFRSPLGLDWLCGRDAVSPRGLAARDCGRRGVQGRLIESVRDAFLRGVEANEPRKTLFAEPGEPGEQGATGSPKSEVLDRLCSAHHAVADIAAEECRRLASLDEESRVFLVGEGVANGFLAKLLADRLRPARTARGDEIGLPGPALPAFRAAALAWMSLGEAECVEPRIPFRITPGSAANWSRWLRLAGDAAERVLASERRSAA